MKIILIKDVKKQGKSGDILEVKDGYGNFLINKGDAVLATSNSRDRLDRENKEKEIKENNLIKECEIIKKKIENLKMVISIRKMFKEDANGKLILIMLCFNIIFVYRYY